MSEEKDTQLKPNILLKRKEDQELRIYFFVADRPQIQAQIERKIIYVTGFKLEDAFELSKRKGEGFNLMYTAQNPTVREFLHELELESLAYEALLNKGKGPGPMPIPDDDEILKEKPLSEEKPLSPVQINFERFRSGLLLFANEEAVVFEDPEDREKLKKIISGLKYEPPIGKYA